MIQEDNASTEIFIILSSFRKRFQRLLNSDKLNDKINFNYSDWIEKIRAKLAINYDYFNNENAKINYVLSRLIERALNYIIFYFFYNVSLNLYLFINEILNDLKKIFDDSNKIQSY